MGSGHSLLLATHRSPLQASSLAAWRDIAAEPTSRGGTLDGITALVKKGVGQTGPWTLLHAVTEVPPLSPQPGSATGPQQNLWPFTVCVPNMQRPGKLGSRALTEWHFYTTGHFWTVYFQSRVFSTESLLSDVLSSHLAENCTS